MVLPTSHRVSPEKSSRSFKGCGRGLQKGWGNLNAGDPEVIPMTKPCGKEKSPKPSLLHFCMRRVTFVPLAGNFSKKKAGMFSKHCFSGSTCLKFGEGYSHIKRCDLRFSTSMPAKFHLFWEVSLRDLVFERWFTSTWVSKKNG